MSFSVFRRSPLALKRCAEKWERLYLLSCSRVSNRYCCIVRSPIFPVPIPKTNYVNFIFDKYHKVPEIHNKVALINGETDEKFTYNELVRASRAVASALTRMGFKKGDVLCIFSTNCPEFAFMKFGALMCGGTVTCASSAFVEDELLYQLRDSKSRYLVVSSHLADIAKKAAKSYNRIKKIIVIDGDGSDGTMPFDDLLRDDGGADPTGSFTLDTANDIAVLPYSSGTTGVPKGVMLSHENICTNLLQCGSVIPCYEVDVALALLPLYHIYGMIPILGLPILTGATVVTLPSFKPRQFVDTIINHKANILHVVPPIVLFMKDHEMAQEADFSHVRYIGSAAAPLAKETQEEFIEYMRKRNPHISIAQAYGLSETSPGVMGNPSGWVKPGSAGVLMPNNEAKVIDVSTGKSLGPHGEGEIITRGPNIMLGYLNNEKATANTIKDGWFHTGDIGYYDEQGFFYIIDRVKELIKYKGLQIPPAELEGLLLSHPDIIDAAVVPKDDERCGELPVAFIVRQDAKNDLSTEDIDAFITERVSDYKRLRGGIHFVDSIPKSQSGKILRRVLRQQLKDMSP